MAQMKAGGWVRRSLNIKDISTSSYCQQRNGVTVRRLDGWDKQDQEWTQMPVEDRHATPADLAAFRLNFQEFLRSLSRRDRRIAIELSRK